MLVGHYGGAVFRAHEDLTVKGYVSADRPGSPLMMRPIVTVSSLQQSHCYSSAIVCCSSPIVTGKGSASSSGSRNQQKGPAIFLGQLSEAEDEVAKLHCAVSW